MFPSPIPATNVWNPVVAPSRSKVPVPVVVEDSLTLSASTSAASAFCVLAACHAIYNVTPMIAASRVGSQKVLRLMICGIVILQIFA